MVGLEEAPLILSGVAVLLGFVLVWSREMVMLKVKTQMNKSSKVIIDVTKDKNVKFGVENLDKDSKLVRGKDSIEWHHTRQYFCPQLGRQAAFVLQGSNSIFDPLEQKEIDLADGEVVDRMVKRAELMRDLNQGWFDTKEQKLLLIVLVVAIIGVVLTFAVNTQVSDFAGWSKATLTAIQASVQSIPRAL